MSTADLRNQLKSLAEARFAYAFGVADLDTVLAAEPDALGLVGEMGTVPSTASGVPPPFSRAVVFGMPLQNAVMESLVDRPTPLYFHLYRQVNYQLDSVALEAAAMLQHGGFQAVAIAASQLVAHEPMRGHVSHRVLGWAAGLGWWGRNNLLVNPAFGSRVRYVSVLTDAPMEPDRPLPASRDCGACVACVRVCPASAIGGKREEFRLDLCYQKLCEFSRIPFVGQHVCGICVKACHPTHWPRK